MVSIPLTFKEFSRTYLTEAQCRALVEQIRWPKGFICPNCNSSAGKRLSTRKYVWRCQSCRVQTSATANTLLQGVRSILNFFKIALKMCEGLCAFRISKELGLNYANVWMTMNKLRSAMEKSIPANAMMVHFGEFSGIIFRRSRESSSFEHPFQPEAKLHPRIRKDRTTELAAKPRRQTSAKVKLVETAVSYIAETFGGISRKYLMKYLAGFSCRDWTFSNLAAACMDCAPVNRRSMEDYTSPIFVKLLNPFGSKPQQRS